MALGACVGCFYNVNGSCNLCRVVLHLTFSPLDTSLCSRCSHLQFSQRRVTLVLSSLIFFIMDTALDAEAAAAVDMDALFASPPSQQRQMLGHLLHHKILAVQPQIATEISEQLLETCDVNELVS